MKVSGAERSSSGPAPENGRADMVESVHRNGQSRNVVVIISALNEARSIGLVLADLPGDWVREVVVVDSLDR